MDILNHNLKYLLIDKNFNNFDNFLFIQTDLFRSFFIPKSRKFLKYILKYIINDRKKSIFYHIQDYNFIEQHHININTLKKLSSIYYIYHDEEINMWLPYLDYYTYLKIAQKISLNKTNIIFNSTLIMAIQKILFNKNKLKRLYQLLITNGSNIDMSLKNNDKINLLGLILRQHYPRKLYNYDKNNLRELYQKIINYLLTLPNIEPNNFLSKNDKTFLNILYEKDQLGYERYLEREFANEVLIKLINIYGYDLNRKVNNKRVEKYLLNYINYLDYAFLISLGAELGESIIAGLNDKLFNLRDNFTKNNLKAIFEYFLRLIKQNENNSDFHLNNLDVNQTTSKKYQDNIFDINHLYYKKFISHGAITMPMMVAYTGILEILREILTIENFDVNLRAADNKNVLDYTFNKQEGKDILSMVYLLINSGKLAGGLSILLIGLIFENQKLGDQRYQILIDLKTRTNLDFTKKLIDVRNEDMSANKYIQYLYQFHHIHGNIPDNFKEVFEL